jgi:hypothetical protein
MDSDGAQIGAEWNRRSSSALETFISDDESRWYGSTGRLMKRPLSDWPETLQVCGELIAFDTVLCRGVRHDITKVDSSSFLQPAMATVALGRGCESCGSSPEGAAVFGSTPSHTLPLLCPVPTHASTLRATQAPSTTPPSHLYARCEECLRGRWCEVRWTAKTEYTLSAHPADPSSLYSVATSGGARTATTAIRTPPSTCAQIYNSASFSKKLEEGRRRL